MKRVLSSARVGVDSKRLSSWLTWRGLFIASCSTYGLPRAEGYFKSTSYRGVSGKKTYHPHRFSNTTHNPLGGGLNRFKIWGNIIIHI